MGQMLDPRRGQVLIGYDLIFRRVAAITETSEPPESWLVRLECGRSPYALNHVRVMTRRDFDALAREKDLVEVTI